MLQSVLLLIVLTAILISKFVKAARKVTLSHRMESVLVSVLCGVVPYYVIPGLNTVRILAKVSLCHSMFYVVLGCNR